DSACIADVSNIGESQPREPKPAMARGRSLFIINKAEEWSLAIALGMMMLLPLFEIVLRQFNRGISGNSGMQQHLVLFVAMIGGVIAARDSRLLSLSTFTAYLRKTYAQVARTV